MLDKTFDPKAFEATLAERWETSGAYSARPDSNAEKFSLSIPPPNVTGSLHIGHALNNTLQDVLVRWRRMQGRDVLWMPGTDHAGIATQMVVERQLAAKGVDRRDLGREKFVETVWQWKAESGGTITRQLRRLGASVDWPRERFTMDDGLSKAVTEVFVTLHEQGLIYRAIRLVNWDPKFQTAISDLEVEQREVKGTLWYIRYPGADGGEGIVVATTRPETMFADVAVAVHPDDERYRALVGSEVKLPLVERRIKITADEYSDPAKGTGAVKITPGHDFNDEQVGKRHGLPAPCVLDAEGRMRMDGPPPINLQVFRAPEEHREFLGSLNGLDRFEARRRVVARLDELGLIEKAEPHTHMVPHGDRSGVPIEPWPTLQWYCNAEFLAKEAIKSVEDGRTQFVPKQWENTFFSWMRNIQPWCISRQLWWGHRIPAWVSPNFGDDGLPDVFVARTEEEARAQAVAKYGAEDAAKFGLTRDPDVLDTWFSSALWPFSTLGWPEQNRDLDRYYPNDVVVTGFDIIFFWIARMMMMGLHFMGDVPFRQVYVHALVRDARGQKMSKSKGNVMDPLDLIDRYGADALRFTLTALSAQGRDVKLDEARLDGYRAFATKIWNAARFLEMNACAPVASFDPVAATTTLNRWILGELALCIDEANAALEAYRFNDYAAATYRFAWNVFCDWYVELAKPVLQGADGPEKTETRATAAFVLDATLHLLHPAMPFVTEALWTGLADRNGASLIRAAWPEADRLPRDASAKAEIDAVVRLVSGIRAVRAELNVPAGAQLPLLLSGDADAVSRLERWQDAIKRLARLSRIEPAQGDPPKGSAQIPLSGATAILPVAEVIDLAAERARLAKEIARMEAEIARVDAKLNNPDFRAKAKPEVIEENEERRLEFTSTRARLAEALARIAA
jgi:valyl-tRNA synthetase